MKSIDWFEKEWLKIKESPYYFVTTYLRVKNGGDEVDFTPNCSEEGFNDKFFKFSPKRNKNIK